LGANLEALTGEEIVNDANSYGMPRDDEIRLAMGELTADQMRTAKAAIRWALTRKCSPGPSHISVSRSLAERTEAMFRSVDPQGVIAQEWSDALSATNRDGEK
jgi:uncharacterized membrane protein YtjA (UPF0391 family)